MRYFEIISESPEQDGAMASQAQAAASTVLHAIVADPKPEHEVELGKYGDFFLYNPKALGLTKDYPELSDLAVMIGKPQKNAIGNSGAVMNFGETILGKYSHAIIIYCVRELTEEGVRKWTNSTSFLEIFAHEFMHVLDNKRTNNAIIPRGGSKAFSDQNAYYNSASEFNAYYHDIVASLTSFIRSNPDDLVDMADLYNFSGDFRKDLPNLLQRNMYTQSFVKWLRDDRRKALLKRIYKLYDHVSGLVKAARDKKEKNDA
jgi:hypothetical protein